MITGAMRSIIAAAVGGFLAAMVVDINAWSRSDGQFDWGLAAKRWVAGAITGALSGLGITDYSQ